MMVGRNPIPMMVLEKNHADPYKQTFKQGKAKCQCCAKAKPKAKENNGTHQGRQKNFTNGVDQFDGLHIQPEQE